MQYYLEDKDLYVDMPDEIPANEAMRQIQDTIYTGQEVDPVGEVRNAFTRSTIQSVGNLALSIADQGDQIQNEPLKVVAGNVGKGAHIKGNINPVEFGLFGFGGVGSEYYKEGYREYEDDSLQDFISSMGSDISKRGSELNDSIVAFAEQVAPYNEEVWRGEFMDNPSWTRGVSTVVSAIPSLATAVAVTATTRNPMSAAIVLGGFEGLQAKEEARKAGIEGKELEAVKISVGVGSAILENMSLGVFFDNIKANGAAAIGKAVIKGTIVEGLEEASQQVWGNIIAKLGYDEARGLTEGIVESFIAGAGSGGVVGGLSAAIPKALNTKIQDAKDKGVTQNDIDVVNETITGDMVNNGSKINIVIEDQMDKVNEFPVTEETVDLAEMGTEELQDAAIESITQGVEQRDAITQYVQNKEIKQNVKNVAANYAYRQLRPDRIFKMMDNFSEGVFTKKVWKPISKAAFVKKDLYGNYVKDVTEIAGGVIQGKTFNKVTTKVKGLDITEDTAMFVYANSLNEDNMVKLKESGLTDSEISKISNSLSKEARATVDKTMQYFESNIYDEMAAKYKNVTGKDLPKVSKYFPIRGLEDAGAIDTIELDFAQRFEKKQVRKEVGAVKERVGGEQAFKKFSFFDTVNKYLNDASHYISHVEAIQDASELLMNKKVKQAVRDKYGNELVRINDKWLEDVSYGGFKPANSTWEKASRFLRKNFVTAVLGYNLNTVAKQPISFIQGMNMIGERAAINGVSRFIQDPKEAIKFAESRSLLIKHRNFTQERTLNEIVQGKSGVEIFGDKNVMAMVKDGGMMPIQWADKATVTSLWLGAYFNKTSKGISEAKAVDYANSVIEKTQPMGGVTFLPDDFRAGWLQQMYTTFRNQPSQNLNILFEITGETAIKKNATMHDYMKLGKGYAYMMLFGAFMIGVITRKELPTVGEFAQDAVSMPLRGAMFFGDMAIAGIQALNGDTYFAKKSLVPTGLGALESAIGALGSKTPEAKMKNFTKFMFEITGAPYKPYKLFTSKKSSKKKAL